MRKSLCASAAFGLIHEGLSVKAAAPDMLVVLKMWGVGGFSPTEAALSEMKFLCSKFHYVRVEEELRQLGYGTQ